MPPLPGSKKTLEGPPLQWQPVIWYFLFTLGMLWFWQEAAPRAALRTIPYSQFKDDLKRGEVVECVVKQAEISGKIQPKPATFTETSRGPTKMPAPGSIPASKKLEDKAPSESKSEAPGNKTTTQAKSPPAFMFRTVRVEDPDLVNDLEQTWPMSLMRPLCLLAGTTVQPLDRKTWRKRQRRLWLVRSARVAG
jgi:hypothetical protein